MNFMRMIIRTETANANGQTTYQTDRIYNIPESEVHTYRQAARESAPRGATRTIKVVPEH